MQLILNAGSSTLKWAVYADEEGETRILSGAFDRFGDACQFTFGSRTESIHARNHAEALQFLLAFLGQNNVTTPALISSCVHRVVHGGERYHFPTVVDASVLAAIEELSALAPLHNPANLAAIRSCMVLLPHAKQIAVFDTAFHQTIGREVFLYGIPYVLYTRLRVRKYGFHGISHAYVARVLRSAFGEDVDAISCHLGSGSSITALKRGLSMDTTMGFTPLDGVIMSTRPGELDPAIPLFLMREGHFTLEEVEEMLQFRSGLYGLTGLRDMREVWERARSGDEQCKLGLEMLSYRVAYFVNAMRTAVPEPRAIVFTGGIGENAWYIRERVMQLLRIPLDRAANRVGGPVISAPESPVAVLVIAADEQRMMHWLARSIQ